MQAPASMLICSSWCRIQQQHDLHKAQLSILSVCMWYMLHVACPQILIESSLVGMNACTYKHIHTCVHTSHAYTLHYCTCSHVHTIHAMSMASTYIVLYTELLYVEQQPLKLPNIFHIQCASTEQHYKTSYTRQWNYFMYVRSLHSCGSTHQYMILTFFGCKAVTFSCAKILSEEELLQPFPVS